ncbi:MAG: response regulator [Sulfurospirillaceae bacterium]|nr:response regulator [Sulfurospirillaceae bacterium]
MDSHSLSSLREMCRTKRVLYVEDDFDVRTQTRKMLELYFKEIVEFDNGLDALACFGHEPFDLIFTDINMPKMDGLCMIGEIRKLNPTIPIVIFSAYDNTEYFLKTIQQGVSGYILKPFSFKDILETLEKIMHQLSTCKLHALALIEGYYWERATQCLCKEHQEVKLSKHETALFDLLTSSKQRVFSSEEIEIAIFDDDFSDNKRVRNLLSRLRQKLGCDLIQSIYGEGYKLRWLH